jgi:hypothetical protein
MLGLLMGVQRQVEESDPDGLLAGSLPRMAATEEQVAEFERESQQAFPVSYRQFLLHANGWPGAYFTLDLFGLDELRSGGSVPHAKVLLDTYAAEDVLEESGLAVEDVVAVASSQGNDLVLMIREGRPEAGTVIWFDGEEYGRYQAFSAFVLELIAILQTFLVKD